MIENAEVFLSLDGILKTKISQRRPIGRVLGNNGFYLDRLGKKMPLSKSYSARVPVLVNMKEKDIVDAFPIVDYINNDQFLTEHITSITLLNGGYYQIELRQTNFNIFFGKVERIDEKFNNFKAFYKKGLKDDLLNTYKMVDLQFGNQVVCTKK
jgi:cell division protein FtsQ